MFSRVNLLYPIYIGASTISTKIGTTSQGLPSTVFLLGVNMHLLYVDESGSTHDPNLKYFVLAGLSVFERQG